ncbi:phage scaffolding protein [Staphylococcus sp. LKG3-3]|uniref:phage scaffolding protein n=1 Tax=Staphylococcus sp. LKG3-3 TaxID=3399685 RepID=UPI003D3A562B
MAFSREELRGIGVDDEKIDSIMALHGKDVQDLQSKEEQARADLESAQQESKLYKERVDEQNSKLDELRNQVNSGEDLNEQIKALKEANTQKDEQHQQEMNKVKLRYEIDKELDRAGAKNRIAVMALVNQDEVSLSDDNGVKGLSEQLESLKESDSYLFNDTNSSSSQSNSGGNNNGSSQQQGGNDSNSGDINYNAGQSKGNNGNPPAEGTIGRKNAERLLGKK